jgi:hypothetical protein
MDDPIPYSDRCIRTESGTALIWPFLNLKPSQEKVELFLDNNAFTRSHWLSELPEILPKNKIVNPGLAIQEQWFSNPNFCNNPETRINDWNKNLASHGINFHLGYADQQIQLIRKNESALRRQFSSTVPFVAIMKCLLSKNMHIDDSLRCLIELGQSDIPRFTGAIALTALGVALKKYQSFRWEGDPKPSYSYLSSFLDFQPSKGEDDLINVPYLRNRAGDLNMFFLLPVLRQLGYSIGSGSALVTGDKALHRVIFRAVPPVMTYGGQTSIALFPDQFTPEIFDAINSVVSRLKPRGTTTLDEQRTRMKRLFNLAKSWVNDERERDALDEIFSDWWLPGHGVEIRPL